MAENNNVMPDWFERQRQERLAELQELRSRIAGNEQAGASGTNTNALRSLLARVNKSEDTPTTQPSTAQPQMPQAVLVEVRGLFETRPVTNMLRSPNFRRDLENIVRASVNAAESRSRAESNTSIATQQSHSDVTSAPPTPPQPRPRQRTQGSAQRTPPPPPPLYSEAAPATVSVPAAPTPPTDNTLTFNEARLLDNLHREQLVVDISELLHSQLVSTTLNSGFRDQLENLLMENHVDPQSGQQSIAALSQLPPSGRIRNDFSHLGIPSVGLLQPPLDDSDRDSISILSAAAAQVPMSHTSLGMAREMQAMRSEMREMQRTLRLVFDMQSELHRAIRQEVAAAIASSVNSPGNAATAPPVSSRPTTAAGRCLICLSARADTVAYRCGHLCMCNTCAASLGHHSRRTTCPVCRAPVEDLLRVYVCDKESD